MAKQVLPVLFILLQFTVASLHAQRHGYFKYSKKATGAGFSNAQGDWALDFFPANIIKASFKPEGYRTNEKLSNKVQLKPVKSKMSIASPYEMQGRRILEMNDEISIGIEENMLWFYHSGNLITIVQEAIQKDGFNGFALRLQQGENIFFGSDPALLTNRRGQRFIYEHGADNLSESFFISSKGYGIFFNNSSKGYVDIGKTNPNIFEAGFVSGELNFYIIPGRNAEDILRKYSRLTGTQHPKVK